MPDSGYSRSPILLKGALVELSKGFLGPVPNIIMEGSGKGFQLDMELRHAIQEHWELGAGLRYWYLRATRGDRKAASNVHVLRQPGGRRRERQARDDRIRQNSFDARADVNYQRRSRLRRGRKRRRRLRCRLGVHGMECRTPPVALRTLLNWLISSSRGAAWSWPFPNIQGAIR